MDATIKATKDETVIRLANGCTVHEHDSPDGVVAQCWVPGGECVYEGRWLAKALRIGVEWGPYAD